MSTDETDKPTTEPTSLSVEDWGDKCWKVGFIQFHKDQVHRLMEKNADRLLCGKQNVKILFPLCGKAIDMHWLWGQGHTIVGLEGVEQAIKEFFEENNIPYTSEPVEEIEGHVFKSMDGRIRIYRCDVFKFNAEVEGVFEAIWDRAALVAVNTEDRGRYANLMKSLLSVGGRYHVALNDYDTSLHQGPPHYIHPDELNKLYGDDCSVTYIDQVDDMCDFWREKGLTYFNETLHEIIKK